MAESAEAGELFWVDPQRRGVLPLDGLHVSRRLARSFLSGDFEIARRPRLRRRARRLRRPAGDLDQRRDPAALPRPAPARLRAFGRDLARRAARGRPLRRRARRGVLRREHVQPAARRLEVRADRAGRAPQRRRLPPARHPVRHRPPGPARRRRDQPRRLSPRARRGGRPAGALPRAARRTPAVSRCCSSRPRRRSAGGRAPRAPARRRTSSPRSAAPSSRTSRIRRNA